MSIYFACRPAAFAGQENIIAYSDSFLIVSLFHLLSKSFEGFQSFLFYISLFSQKYADGGGAIAFGLYYFPTALCQKGPLFFCNYKGSFCCLHFSFPPIFVRAAPICGKLCVKFFERMSA